MRNFWISWIGPDHGFELHWPWWVSGYRLGNDEDGDTPTICAAVQAKDEDGAKEIILACHDERPKAIEWRFCSEREDGWSPFNSRFPRAKWMRWPAAPEMKEHAP